jgi:hypothetical protein
MPTLADDKALAQDLAGFSHNPLGYVRYAFPWGKKGTELEHKTGPRDWQKRILVTIGELLKQGVDRETAIQMAVASGHGIGKSALVSWLVKWALETHEDTKGVVTANTEAQLRTKTWPELAKWHGLSITKHWFKFTATALHSVDPEHEKTWRVDAIPWSDTNTEAFAGLHNEGKRILLIFDEASAIADKVWEVAEGALTDSNTEIIWAAFGNPTRNTGRFRECFGRFAHRWDHRQIDSRSVEGTNKAQLDAWVADYGEDSDFVRVRVKGTFPVAGSMQFIPSDVVEAAATRDAACYPHDPVVMGVDVARFGEDEAVIRTRRGRDARTRKPIHIRSADLMTLVGRVTSEIAALRAIGWNVDMIFVDQTGVGAGVVDRLRQLGYVVMGVDNGSKPDTKAVDGEAVANKAAEQWAQMRSWLKTGGAIDDDSDLRGQLEGREYGYNQHNEIVLEKKDDMKKRGLSSPDRADALALTFAYPVAARSDSLLRGHAQAQVITDFDPNAF